MSILWVHFIACIAWRFKQSERAVANTRGFTTRRNLGERQRAASPPARMTYIFYCHPLLLFWQPDDRFCGSYYPSQSERITKWICREKPLWVSKQYIPSDALFSRSLWRRTAICRNLLEKKGQTLYLIVCAMPMRVNYWTLALWFLLLEPLEREASRDRSFWWFNQMQVSIANNRFDARLKSSN